MSIVLAGLLAACGSTSSTEKILPPEVVRAFDGAWAACRNDGATDYREIVTVDGTSAGVGIVAYGTADLTCDGDGLASLSIAGTAVYGGQVAAGLGAGSVQATKVDWTLSTTPPETIFTLIYRDTAASPDALHLGDDSGTHDGSSAALRPVSLQGLARAQQTPPVAADLTGDWRYCPATGGGTATIDAATRSFDFRKYAGTCGAGTPVERVAGTYTLGTPVYATHGGITVTAFATDLAITTPVVANFFTTFWVDKSVTPWALYSGDDMLHGMDGSTPSLRPRVLRSAGFAKQ